MTAMIFALNATAILGVVGLATEAGTWYVARTQAYNVAYAAAIAGALAADYGSDAAAAANDIVAANHYTTGTVTVNPSATGAAATEVLVSVNFDPLLARLFTQHQVTVTARAVGDLRTAFYPACVLSLTGDLTIAQNQGNISNGQWVVCYYASNAAGATAVNIDTDLGATILTQGITTVGDCAHCPSIANIAASDGYPQSVLTGGFDVSGQSVLFRPTAAYQPATRIDTPWTNGAGTYTAVDTLNVPATSITCPTGLTYLNAIPHGGPITTDGTTHCPNIPGAVLTTGALIPSDGDGAGAATCIAAPTSSPPTYCGYYNMSVIVPTGTTMTLTPINRSGLTPLGNGDSTYLFLNASLTVESGASILCRYLNSGTNAFSTCAAGDQVPNSVSTDGKYGVTFVLTGDQPGTLTIASGATANLSSPRINTFGCVAAGCSSVLSGILFYRSGPNPGDSAGSPGVNIADTTSDVFLSGGMYFPGSTVFYTANTNPDIAYSPGCSVLVAGTVTLGFLNRLTDHQPNPSQFGSGECFSQFVTPLPFVRAARVVQ